MITKEKTKLKMAKQTFNSVKKNHPNIYNDLRDAMIRQIVTNSSPNWGSVRFTITNNGI